MRNELQVILLLCLAFSRQITLAQIKPDISCPEYFEYASKGDDYVGKIVLEDVPFGPLNIEVKFSQREAFQKPFRGRLGFEHDLLTVQKDMEEGRPIIYRVDFPQYYELPKLIRIVVNDEVKCSAPDYSGKKFSFTLRRNFNPSPGSERRVTSTTTTEPTTTTVAKITQASTSKVTVTAQADVTMCGNQTEADLRRGRFPWLTAIFVKETSNIKWLCSGSIISSRTILSASHCFQTFDDSSEFFAFFGPFTTDRSILGEGRKIQSVLSHPNYKGFGDTSNDIALLHTKWSISFNEYIQPVCIWEEIDSTSLLSERTGYFASWGGVPETFVQLTVPTVQKFDLMNPLGCFRHNLLRPYLTELTFCGKNSAEDGNGPCRGDSGGGVVVNHNGLWTVRGIISSAIHDDRDEKCFSKQYVIFTDVAKHHAWVHNNSESYKDNKVFDEITAL